MDSIGLLTELVSNRTISGDPGPQRTSMQAILSAVSARVSGLTVQQQTDVAHPWILMTNDCAPQAPRLLFACHVDTVPAGELSAWEFDPFGATVEGDLVLGRGASDMKAGMVAATEAFIVAVQSGRAAGLLLTSDEEIGSLGALAARHAVGDCTIGAIIVPEATGNRIHLGHRGALWLSIVAKGVAAHGSTPERGENAILKLVDVLGRSRAELPLGRDAFLGCETANVGVIEGGSVPNIVPDFAQVVVDHRTVGDGAALRLWWQSQPEVAEVTTRIDLPAVQTAADAPWVGTLTAHVADTPVSYFTDASVLAAAAPHAPIVVWGPGTPSLMHAANESVSTTEVVEAVKGYCDAARAWPIVD